MRRNCPYLIAIFVFVLVLTGCDQLKTPTHAGTPVKATATRKIAPTRTFIPSTAPWENLPTPTVTPFSPLNVSESELQGSSIRFWYIGVPSDEIGLMVDVFNSTNQWGIKVDSQAFAGYGELNETLDETMYEAELPDLLTGYNFQAALLDSSGRKLIDLNDYVNDPIWGFSLEEKNDFYPIFWEQDVNSKSGKRYGLPFQRDGLILFYNTSWAKELGFTSPPSTSKDFARQVCAAAAYNNKDARNDNNNTGGWVISTDPSTLTAWLLAFEAPLLNASGRYAFNSPESAEALKFLQRLGDDGCAWQTNYPHPHEEFADRKALLITATTRGLAQQLQALWELENGDEWQLLPYPGKNDEPVMIVRGSGLLVMESTPTEQLAAWLFARWLLTPENQARRIAAEGGFPTRISTLEQLQSYARSNPKWQQAIELLPYARSEPSDASWTMIRWVLSDTLTQLYDPNTTSEDIPQMLKLLEQLTVEAGVQYR